jgi:nitrous oxidase accessory protein NosD
MQLRLSRVLLVGLATITLLAPAVLAQRVIEVPKDYETIQFAISAADPGDKILVAPGYYQENLVIQKSISLEGTDLNLTTIDGSTSLSHEPQPTLLIEDTQDVSVKNLTITGGYTGVRIVRSQNVKIIEAIIRANLFYGIAVIEQSSADIAENQILSTLPGRFSPSGPIPALEGAFGDGIVVAQPASARIYDNRIAFNAYSGIHVWGATIQIMRNQIEQNAHYGIVLEPGLNESLVEATLAENRLISNGGGIAILDDVRAHLVANQIVATRLDSVPSPKGLAFNVSRLAISNGHGIWVSSNAEVQLNQNEISETAGHGLMLESGRITLGPNTIRQSAQCGLYVDEGAWLLSFSTLVLQENHNGNFCGQARLLQPDQTQVLPLVLTQSGSLRVRLVSFFPEARLRVVLRLSGQPVAQAEGIGQVQISFTLSEELLAQNRVWELAFETLDHHPVEAVWHISVPVKRGSCESIQLEFLIRLEHETNAPPFSESRCEALYSALQALPERIRAAVRVISRGPALATTSGIIGGSYLRMEQKIILYGETAPLRRWVQSFLHEVGHAVYDSLLTVRQRERWTEMHNRSEADPDFFLSVYAQVNRFEDFAETFALYFMDTLGLSTRVQQSHLMGKTLLSEKFKLLSELFRFEIEGSPLMRIYRLLIKSSESESRLTLQRRTVPLSAEGMPVNDPSFLWIDF